MINSMTDYEEYVQEIERFNSNPKTLNIPYGFLSDKDIRTCLTNKAIYIDSIDDHFDADKQISGASIDLRLGTKARRIKSGITLVAGNEQDEKFYTDRKPTEHGYISIAPHEMILVNTMERLLLPADILGILTGRSSIARVGLMIHCCQSLIVPGHIQNIPLQITNMTENTIHVEVGTRICQLALVHMQTPSDTPYYRKNNSKYVKERAEPFPSMLSGDPENSVRPVKEDTKNHLRTPLWLHRIIHNGWFMGTLTGMLGGFLLEKAEIFSASQYSLKVNGAAVILVILVLLGILYLFDWISHRKK